MRSDYLYGYVYSYGYRGYLCSEAMPVAVTVAVETQPQSWLLFCSCTVRYTL